VLRVWPADDRKIVGVALSLDSGAKIAQPMVDRRGGPKPRPLDGSTTLVENPSASRLNQQPLLAGRERGSRARRFDQGIVPIQLWRPSGSIGWLVQMRRAETG
jgi:hypothetical protein